MKNDPSQSTFFVTTTGLASLSVVAALASPPQNSPSRSQAHSHTQKPSTTKRYLPFFSILTDTTQTTNHKPQTTNHKPQTTNHKPQTTNHKPQTTNHKPQTTNHNDQQIMPIHKQYPHLFMQERSSSPELHTGSFDGAKPQHEQVSNGPHCDVHRGRRARVSFSAEVQVRFTHNNDDISMEKPYMFYSKPEYRYMKAYSVALANENRWGRMPTDTESDSVRGLEYLSKPGARCRHEKKTTGWNAVLCEQEFQLDAGCYDPQAIADQYARLTVKASREAAERANKDAFAAKQIMIEDGMYQGLPQQQQQLKERTDETTRTASNITENGKDNNKQSSKKLKAQRRIKQVFRWNRTTTKNPKAQ